MQDVQTKGGWPGRRLRVVLRVWVNAVATEGILGDLNPLGDGPCCSLADRAARVPEVTGYCPGTLFALRDGAYFLY